MHPQPESYWGNVNRVGPRSVYDEAKRFAEALTMAYHRVHGLDTKIVRIFNTYGPRLSLADGRVVSNFLDQAMRGAPAHDLRRRHPDPLVLLRRRRGRAASWALLESDHVGPMNIGNPTSSPCSSWPSSCSSSPARRRSSCSSRSPTDDPKQRRPDITLAEQVLGWQPEIELREGLARTHDWYRRSSEQR